MGSFGHGIMDNDTAMDMEWIIIDRYNNGDKDIVEGDYVDWRDVPGDWLKSEWKWIEDKFVGHGDEEGYMVCAFIGMCRGMPVSKEMIERASDRADMEMCEYRNWRNPERRKRRLTEFKIALVNYESEAVHLEKIEEEAESDYLELSVVFDGDRVYMERRGDTFATEGRIRKQEVKDVMRLMAIELMGQFEFAQEKRGETGLTEWLKDSKVKWYKEMN